MQRVHTHPVHQDGLGQVAHRLQLIQTGGRNTERRQTVTHLMIYSVRNIPMATQDPPCSWQKAEAPLKGSQGHKSLRGGEQSEQRSVRKRVSETVGFSRKSVCTRTHQSPECWSTTSNNCEGRKKKQLFRCWHWSVSRADVVNMKPERCSDLPASDDFLTFFASDRTARKWHHWCTEDKLGRTNIWMPEEKISEGTFKLVLIWTRLHHRWAATWFILHSHHWCIKVK